MRDLVIHVGFGKTGTSAIQQALRENADTLGAHGILACDLWLMKRAVGEYGFESADEFIRMLNADRMAFAEKLSRIFDESNGKFRDFGTVIWSNEALAMHWAVLGNVFEGLGSNLNRKIVIYFRNQVDWLISAYLQWGIKDKHTPGRVRGWEEFRNGARNSTDYLSILKNWHTHCKDSVILGRSYDTANDIVADFFDCLQLKVEIKRSAGRVYETPSYTAHSLFKIFNDQFDEAKQPEPLLGLMSEAGVLYRDFHAVDPCLIDVSQESLSELAASFSEMNSQIKEHYGIDLKYSGKSRFLGRRKGANDENTDLIAALLAMVVHLEHRVASMQSTINSLSRRVRPD